VSTTEAQTFWCYKRGLLVLKLSSAPGSYIPTRGPGHPGDADMTPCTFGSGQFMSVEWEPRVRVLLERAQDLVEFIELLEDRRYQVDLEPPSKRARPFRFLLAWSARLSRCCSRAIPPGASSCTTAPGRAACSSSCGNSSRAPPQQGYVANPHTPPGSIHNTGCAVDLSVWDTSTRAAVDMGSPYNFFGARAHPAKEVELWKKGQLTGEQWANRLALREAMLRAGFRPLGHEWLGHEWSL